MNKKEFSEGWTNFCRCINFGDSNLDADAIRFMNEFNKNLDSMFDREEAETIVKVAVSTYGFDDQVENALKLLEN